MSLWLAVDREAFSTFLLLDCMASAATDMLRFFFKEIILICLFYLLINDIDQRPRNLGIWLREN
jgi:hypothetical protein